MHLVIFINLCKIEKKLLMICLLKVRLNWTMSVQFFMYIFIFLYTYFSKILRKSFFPFHGMLTQEKIFKDICKKVSQDGRALALIEKGLSSLNQLKLILKSMLKGGSFPLINGTFTYILFVIMQSCTEKKLCFVLFMLQLFQVVGSSAVTKSGIICRIGEKIWARRSFDWSTLGDLVTGLPKKIMCLTSSLMF